MGTFVAFLRSKLTFFWKVLHSLEEFHQIGADQVIFEIILSLMVRTLSTGRSLFSLRNREIERETELMSSRRYCKCFL